MADYFTQFSCMFDVGSAENAATADDIREKLAAEQDRDEGNSLGFEMEAYRATVPGALWIHSDECGEPEHVIAFVLRCAAAFDMTGLWGLTWGLSRSRPRLDGFGGGAQLIDLTTRQSLEWMDCAHWLGERLAAGGPASPPQKTDAEEDRS